MKPDVIFEIDSKGYQPCIEIIRRYAIIIFANDLINNFVVYSYLENILEEYS